MEKFLIILPNDFFFIRIFGANGSRSMIFLSESMELDLNADKTRESLRILYPAASSLQTGFKVGRFPNFQNY
jgi:hypothetical protein